MNRNVIFYIIMIAGCGLLLWLLLLQGQTLEIQKGISEQQLVHTKGENPFFGECLHNLQQPMAIFILQILSIILAARLLGWLVSKIGQPTVIGEIIAGIVLGPSLLGLLFPGFSLFLFPKTSLPNLQFLSQIGLILFMFIIGMELDVSVLKKHSHEAVMVSHASIICPCLLGVWLAYFLYLPYAPARTPFSAFALFMGIAMSITAFPVLARIIQERGMTKTALGTTAITCAAADDVTAWCLLATLIAFIKAGKITGALITVVLAVGYILLMLYAVKPLLNHVAIRYFTRETVNKPILALILLIVLWSAYLTEIIGIHALFGAFVAGIIIPANSEFRHVLAEKIEDVSLVLLLPLFFAFSGLRTQIGLLNTLQLWGICLLIIIVAVAGKFLGSALASKFVGQTWQESLMLGALMNTRGLVELVVLNIGYDLGVLSPEIFTMMVIMALVTTLMTGPLLDLISHFSQTTFRIVVPSRRPDYQVLISFASPQTGSRLLQLVNRLVGQGKFITEVTALHLTPSADVSLQEAKIFEKEGFVPILHTAQEIGMEISPQYKVSNEASREIINFANQGHFDLMLVGSSRPYETGGNVKTFLADVTCAVGVLLDRGFQQIDKILLIADRGADEFLAKFGQKFLQNADKHITILDNHNILKDDATLWGMKTEQTDSQVVRVETAIMDLSFLGRYHLVLMSLECWNKLNKQKTAWLKYSPSILLVNKSMTPPTTPTTES